MAVHIVYGKEFKFQLDFAKCEWGWVYIFPTKTQFIPTPDGWFRPRFVDLMRFKHAPVQKELREILFRAKSFEVIRWRA